MTKLLGIALLSALAALLIRECGKEWGILLGAAGTVILLSEALSTLFPLLEKWSGWLTEGGVGIWVPTALKGMGICLCTEFGAQFCRDAGENGIAKALEWAGRVMILSLAFPLMERLAELTEELIG